jgi:hypothetical protein
MELRDCYLTSTLPRLRRPIVGLTPRRAQISPRPVHMRFVMDKVPVGQVFLRELRFSSVNIIPLMLHTHSLIYHRRRGPGWLRRFSASLRTGRSGDRMSVEARFSAPFQTSPGSHPAPYTIDIGCGVALPTHPI